MQVPIRNHPHINRAVSELPLLPLAVLVCLYQQPRSRFQPQHLLLIDFVQQNKINSVFCGHTHELEIMRTTDLYKGTSFTQYMCGTLSSSNNGNDDNMFLYYENFGNKDMHVYLTRIFPKNGTLLFKEEKVFQAIVVQSQRVVLPRRFYAGCDQ